jgi:transcriptional regulator
VNGELNVSHVPIMLDRKKGQYGALVWHMANLNLHAHKLDGVENTLCIFHGPHAYISPAWYKNHPSVPTWNYAVVHAYGAPCKISAEELSNDLAWMVSYHESQLHQEVDYVLSDEYKAKLLKHVTGFRMEITRIEGKFKLGQNRSQEDQLSMLNELRNENSRESVSLADFIEACKKIIISKE